MKLIQSILVLFILIVVSKVALSDELTERKEIQTKVKQCFMTDNFKELDNLAEKYRNTKERSSSGLWKLTIFYYGFNKFTGTKIKSEKYWTEIKDKVNNWIGMSPDSPTAYIAKGLILNGYAWKFRGGSWAYEVPKEAWRPFKENLLVANKHMMNSKAIASVDPHWYEVTAHIKKALNEDSVSFIAFINEGLDNFPEYYQLYFAAIDYLAPKWHGNRLEIEHFANDAVKRTSKNEGMGMYARIYWYASQTQYDEKLFVESNVVWAKMREGIFDVIKVYPDSWNIQNFAYFACLAKDKTTTRALFDKMTSSMIGNVWKNQEYYESCKDFAYSSPNN